MGGFLTSTGVVGKLRYPRRTGEPGNIVMMYVFHENADAFAHKLNQMGFMKDAKAVWQDGDFDDNSGVREILGMALERIQRFHPNVDIAKEWNGKIFHSALGPVVQPTFGLSSNEESPC